MISPTPTPIGDLLHELTGGLAMRSSPGGRPGGEWDPWRALPHRRRARLYGAGYMTRDGVEPDVLASMIVARDPTIDDPIAWFLRMALRALDERQAAARRDRRRRLAKAGGHTTEYQHRQAQARAAGFDTFWQYRQHRKWA